MLFVFILFSSPAFSEVYKCDVGNKKVYQQIPCEGKGGQFDLGTDISIEKQQESVAELKQEMQKYNHKKQLKKKLWDKERLIRAEENKASAAHRNANANRAQAHEQARQTDALKARNRIEANKLLIQR